MSHSYSGQLNPTPGPASPIADSFEYPDGPNLELALLQPGNSSVSSTWLDTSSEHVTLDDGESTATVDIGDVPETDNQVDRPLLHENISTLPFQKDQSTIQLPSTTEHEPVLKPKSRRVSWFWTWRWTLLSLLGALTSFLCLFLIGFAFSGKPLSSWPLGLLSISATVAGLTTVMRLCLMGCVASCITQQKWQWFLPRDGAGDPPLRPLNDLEALIKVSHQSMLDSASWILHHASQLSLLNLGALLLVLSSGFDLFSQLTIRVTVEEYYDAGGVANVPWAHNATDLDEDAFYSAVYNGFLGTEVEDLPVTCSTGNCTWETVPSIGVCGDCRDYTQQWMNESNVYTDHKKTFASESGAFIEGIIGSAYDTNPNVFRVPGHTVNYHGEMVDYLNLLNAPAPNTTLNYSLATGKYRLSNGTNLEYVGLTTITAAINAGDMDDETMGAFPELRIDREHYPVVPLAFGIIDVPYTSRDDNNTFTFGSPTNTHCAFWYCMQALSSEVKAGKLMQTTRNGPSASSMNVDSDTVTLHFNSTAGFNMHGVSFEAHLQGWQIEDRWPSWGSASFNLLGAPERDPMVTMWEKTKDSRADWVARMAKSLSNAVRKQSAVPADDDPRAGRAISQQAYISVMWVYFVYPSVMLVGALCVIVATIVKTVQNEHGVWGDGPLFLLLADVDEEVRSQVRDACSTNGDSEVAKVVGRNLARMEKSDEGWTLRTPNSS